jgi:hypothetical protein
VTTQVRDARPPLVVVRALNVLLRRVLRTPLAHWISPLVLLEFDGRSSGRRYRVPVGWYATTCGRVVFTPARWPANFVGGAPVLVHHRGRATAMVGRLVTDPSITAAAIDEVCSSGTSTRFLAVDVPAGHRITAEEVADLGTAMLCLEPA